MIPTGNLRDSVARKNLPILGQVEPTVWGHIAARQSPLIAPIRVKIFNFFRLANALARCSPTPPQI